MNGTTRSTRVLPGLSQALSWLRQGLPPTDPAPATITAITTAQPRHPQRSGRRQRRRQRTLRV